MASWVVIVDDYGPDDGTRMVPTLTTRYRSAPVPLESEYEQEKIPVLSRVGGESGHLGGRAQTVRRFVPLSTLGFDAFILIIALCAVGTEPTSVTSLT